MSLLTYILTIPLSFPCLILPINIFFSSVSYSLPLSSVFLFLLPFLLLLSSFYSSSLLVVHFIRISLVIFLLFLPIPFHQSMFSSALSCRIFSVLTRNPYPCFLALPHSRKPYFTLSFLFPFIFFFPLFSFIPPFFFLLFFNLLFLFSFLSFNTFRLSSPLVIVDSNPPIFYLYSSPFPFLFSCNFF